MTKWFDTNYHYLVPELGPHTRSDLASDQAVDELVPRRTASGTPPGRCCSAR